MLPWIKKKLKEIVGEAKFLRYFWAVQQAIQIRKNIRCNIWRVFW